MTGTIKYLQWFQKKKRMYILSVNNSIKKLMKREKMKRSEEVYHYTSPEGLVSIFKNKTFQFTDCQFFNDKLEYNYIKKPLCVAISKLENKLLNKDLIADVNNWLNDKYEVYYTGKAKMRS